MNKRNLTLLVANLLLFAVGLGGVAYKHNHPKDVAAVVSEKPIQGQTSPMSNKPELPPVKVNISNATPSYMNYLNTVAQLKKWNAEAPEMTEVGTYGKSSRGTDLYYFRIANKRYSSSDNKPKVLITACIHGNEPLSSSTVMWWIGGILSRYSADSKIAEMVDQRDIYFIPVVSPDSYPNSRHVDGVDPNRNFPTASDPSRRSVAPVQALREFHAKIKPNAVISGHTWGRVFLTPWGDQMKNCPDHEEYKRVSGRCRS